MKWLVRPSGHAPLPIALPDMLVDAQEFPATLSGVTCTAVWYRATGTLVVRDASGLEHLYQMRSATVSRFDGEQSTRVDLELRTPAGMRAMTLAVEPHVPGQEARGSARAKGPQVVRSQITGKVLKVLVRPGDRVAAGDTLCLIEAMKMENRVFAPAPGVVTSVAVKDGDGVSTGKELLKLAAPDIS